VAVVGVAKKRCDAARSLRNDQALRIVGAQFNGNRGECPVAVFFCARSELPPCSQYRYVLYQNPAGLHGRTTVNARTASRVQQVDPVARAQHARHGVYVIDCDGECSDTLPDPRRQTSWFSGLQNFAQQRLAPSQRSRQAHTSLCVELLGPQRRAWSEINRDWPNRHVVRADRLTRDQIKLCNDNRNGGGRWPLGRRLLLRDGFIDMPIREIDGQSGKGERCETENGEPCARSE
jgi:hypothetical protein